MVPLFCLKQNYSVCVWCLIRPNQQVATESMLEHAIILPLWQIIVIFNGTTLCLKANRCSVRCDTVRLLGFAYFVTVIFNLVWLFVLELFTTNPFLRVCVIKAPGKGCVSEIPHNHHQHSRSFNKSFAPGVPQNETNTRPCRSLC